MSSHSSKLMELIRATQAEIARSDRIGLEHPITVSTKLMTSSLQRRLEELEARFADATQAEGLDVCSYRMIADNGGRYPLLSVTRALADFQQFVSVLYEAVRTNKPRNSTKVSSATERDTTMDFAYSFAGSLGVVLTLPRQTATSADTKLDVAVGALFELAKASSPETVSAFARKYGTASVRLAHKWALAHVSAGISVDIEWRRDKAVQHRMLAQVPELRRFAEMIESAGETTTDRVELYGKLVAGNLNAGTFTLEVDAKTQIRGRFDLAFSGLAVVEMSLGRHYTAVLNRQTRRIYATNRQVEEYFLVALHDGLGSSEP